MSYLVRADGSVARVDPPVPFGTRRRGGRGRGPVVVSGRTRCSRSGHPNGFARCCGAARDIDAATLSHHRIPPPADGRRAAVLVLFGEDPRHGPDVLLDGAGQHPARPRRAGGVPRRRGRPDRRGCGAHRAARGRGGDRAAALRGRARWPCCPTCSSRRRASWSPRCSRTGRDRSPCTRSTHGETAAVVRVPLAALADPAQPAPGAASVGLRRAGVRGGGAARVGFHRGHIVRSVGSGRLGTAVGHQPDTRPGRGLGARAGRSAGGRWVMEAVGGGPVARSPATVGDPGCRRELGRRDRRAARGDRRGVRLAARHGGRPAVLRRRARRGDPRGAAGPAAGRRASRTRRTRIMVSIAWWCCWWRSARRPACSSAAGSATGSPAPARCSWTRRSARSLQAVTVVLAAWLVALPLASASFPGLVAGVRGSEVLRAVDSVMPAGAKRLPSDLRQLLNNSGFPDVTSPFVADPDHAGRAAQPGAAAEPGGGRSRRQRAQDPRPGAVLLAAAGGHRVRDRAAAGDDQRARGGRHRGDRGRGDRAPWPDRGARRQGRALRPADRPRRAPGARPATPTR